MPLSCTLIRRGGVLHLHLCSNFFKASRLHFIGSWKARYSEILDSMPPPPPLPPPLWPSGERVILHIDMDCFFCAVAVRGRPELAGMPVAVCWSSADSDKASHGEISSVRVCMSVCVRAVAVMWPVASKTRPFLCLEAIRA